MNNVIFICIILVLLLILSVSIYFIYKNKEKYIENEDAIPSPVILQSFDQFFVSTKSWDNLNSEVPKLSKYFTSFILPPMSMSADEVGFIPKNIYDFDSEWGTEESLKKLIDRLKKHNISIIANVVLQHRQGQNSWFDFKNPSYLENEQVEPKDYYKYIDTLLYSPWGNDDKYTPNNYYIKGLPNDYDTKGLENCYKKNETGNWSLHEDCRNKRPMYNITERSNPSWLQSVNFCNINVLKSSIEYLKKLKNMGIDGIRFDQSDAISPEFISLFLNTDPKLTTKIIEKIIILCEKAKNPNVDKDVIYNLKDKLLSSNVNDLTSVQFKYKIIENFYGYLYGKEDENKGWRGLVEMLNNINREIPLNNLDWTGSFDYALKFILNEMFNTEDMSINGSVFIKENMLIGNNDYKYNTITFVDNHDTDYLVSIFNNVSNVTRGVSNYEIVISRVIPAYFIIMLMPGIPMVQKVYYDIFKKIGINIFIKLRNECGIDSKSDFEIIESNRDSISWKIFNIKPSIIGRWYKHKILKSTIMNTSVILAEINKNEPNDKHIFSQKIYNSDLYMKLSII